MIELVHSVPEPNELADHRRTHPGGSWGDPNFAPVKPIVRRQLNLEQGALCVYCEANLDQDDGHVEHIKSRGANPALTFAYDNMAHSCNEASHCGHHKRRQALPVEPRPGCNRYFVLLALDGKLDAAGGLTVAEAQQATDSIRILGLNVPALAWQRKGFADVVLHLPDPADREAFLEGIPFRWSLRML
jgi:uncharacterized protein (TIGR02646 family)